MEGHFDKQIAVRWCGIVVLGALSETTVERRVALQCYGFCMLSEEEEVSAAYRAGTIRQHARQCWK
jgi:hypothetical protein